MHMQHHHLACRAAVCTLGDGLDGDGVPPPSLPQCEEVMELRHLMTHLRSSCHVTEIPPPALISVDQMIRRVPSKMDTHTTGLVVEHLIPATGQVTFASPKGKV